eukprot:gene8553-10519_t
MSQPAQWVFARKLPQSNYYIYTDSNIQNILYLNTIQANNGFLAQNLDKLNTNGISYALYNDEPWRNDLQAIKETQHPNLQVSLPSLGKGIIAIEKTGTQPGTGFHLKHSLPGFPAPMARTVVSGKNYTIKFPSVYPNDWLPIDMVMGFKRSDLPNYGHVFFCHSFTSDKRDALLDTLSKAAPYIYNSNDHASFTRLIQAVPAGTPAVVDTLINPVNVIVGKLTWKYSNTLPTADKTTLNTIDTSIITETHIPEDFSRQFNAGSLRWRSSIESGHIGYHTQVNNNRVCIGDIYNGETGFKNAEAIICFNHIGLSKLLKLSAYKQRESNGVEDVIGKKTVFSGPVVLPTWLYWEIPTVKSYLESQQDLFIRNSPISLCYSEGCEEFQSDQNGIITFNKNYYPDISISLTDNQYIKFVGVPTASSIIKIPAMIENGVIRPYPPNSFSFEIKLVWIFQMYKVLLKETLANVLPRLGGEIPTVDITLEYNPTTKILIFKDQPNIPIDLNEPLCVTTIYRSFSYYVLSKLVNPSINGHTLPIHPLSINTKSSNSNNVFIRSLVTSFSMYLRQRISPSLSPDMLQSLDYCDGSSVNIEHFNNISMIDVDDGIYSEGWVTALLWDLIDEEVDFRSSTVFYRDEDRVPIGDLLKAIKETNANDNILNFIQRIKTPENTEWVSNVVIYNNIIQCTYCKSNPLPQNEFNSTNLQHYFLRKGICQADLDKVPNIETYVMRWASNYYIADNYAAWWQNNQGLKSFYEDSNIVSKFHKLEKYMGQHNKGSECFTHPSNINTSGNSSDPISPITFAKVTNLLLDLTQFAPVHEELEFSPFEYYYYPPTNGQQDSLAIVLFNGKICAFDFVPNDYRYGQEMYSLCPTQPIISNMEGLSGPPSSQNILTIYGQQLRGVSVDFDQGTKSCEVTPASAGSQSLILCTMPKGVGIKDIRVYNPTLPFGFLFPFPYPFQSNYQFVYDPPVVQSVSGPTKNLPLSGASITLSGDNFFSDSANPDKSLIDILVDQAPIKPTQVFGDSNGEFIVFNPSNGCGEDLLIDLLVGGQYATFPEHLNITFKPPIITSINVTNSPVYGGEWILVTGENFGLPSYDNYVMVSIGGEDCQNVTLISETQIVARIPFNTGKDLDLMVKICGITSEAVLFSYHPPTLLQIVYDSIPTNGTRSIFYVTGLNLGTKVFNHDPYVWIFDNNTDSLDCYSCSDELYMNKVYYDEAGNVIPTPTQQPVGGPFDPYVALGSYKTSVDFDAFYCYIGYGLGRNLTFTVQIFNQTVNSYDDPSIGELRFDLPWIESIYSNSSSTTGGFNLTITGLNYVPNEYLPYILPTEDTPIPSYDPTQPTPSPTPFPGDLDLDGGLRVSNVTVGGKVCKEIYWTNSTSIECTIPPGIGSNLPIQIFVGVQSLSNYAVHNYSYSPPQAQKIEPNTGATEGGVKVTITGSNFVPNEFYTAPESIDGGVEVSNVTIVDGSLCGSIVWINSTTIECTLGQGVGKEHNISVFVGQQQLSNYGQVKFSYSPPQLKENRFNISIGSDEIITIVGSNFIPTSLISKYNGPDQDKTKANIVIGSTDCLTVEWVNSTRALCKVPLGTGKEKLIKVTIEGQSNPDNNYFSYQPPQIDSITPNQGRQSEQTLVTIIGKNFGIPSEPSLPKPTVKFGSQEVTGVTLLSGTQISCTFPSTTEPSIDVVVSLDGQSSNVFQWTTYGPPRINTVIPNTGDVDGGYSITIQGTNLIEDGKPDPTVFMNGGQVSSSAVTIKTKDSIVFNAVRGGGSLIPIYVDLNGQTSNTNTEFSYNSPMISSIVPSVLKTQSASTRIELRGSNLGLSDKTLDSLTIGGVTCSQIEIHSSSYVSCNAPGGLTR